MSKLPNSVIESHRPIPFYIINTTAPAELTYEKFHEDLSYIKACGYGGIVLFNSFTGGFPRGGPYFSDAWFFMVDNALKAAHDLSLRVWIMDDYNAPPGDIGGRMRQLAPHLNQKHITLDENGEVVVLEADWDFPAYEPFESAALFRKYVYEEYKARYSHYFGNTIVGIFSDADSRRVNSNVLFGKTAMKDYFPWVDDFKETFEKTYGYDITPYLPSIIRRETSEQARDYWEHSGERYFGWMESAYTFCKENGLEYTFHTSDSAPFRIETTYFNSAFAEGKAIDAGRHCDWPGTDHERLQLNGGIFLRPDIYKDYYTVWGGMGENCRVENFYDVYFDLRAKQAQSGAYLYRKKGVMCEMYAMTGWRAPYKELHNIAAWQMMQGVTFIVPNSYPYRFGGKHKFGPAVFFGKESYTDFDIRPFNDLLAEESALCEQGDLRVDVALLDPTDYIWRGDGDSVVELDLAKKMNHLPNGYIISDIKNLKLRAKDLKAVVNPDLPLSDEERKIIADLGLKLYEANEVDQIEKDFPTGISWQGDGEIMFMRRDLGNEEMLVVSNVETDDTLRGKLTFAGKTYEIELCSGEMAFFGGGYDKYRLAPKDEIRIALPAETAVSYEKPNSISLMRWEDADGNATSPVKPAARLNFFVIKGWIKEPFELEKQRVHPLTQYLPFTATEAVGKVELLVNESLIQQVDRILLDGKLLRPSGVFSMFADTHLVYPMEIDAGEHRLELVLNAYFEVKDALFLRGDFDVDVTVSDNDAVCQGAGYYICSYLPRTASLSLKKRRYTLKTDESWAMQGQPFYSGAVTYNFEVDIPADMKNPTLVCPDSLDAMKLYIDGEYAASRIMPPHRFSLPTGKHRIALEINNTYANMLEAYKAPSGLLGTPYITEG